MANILYVHGLGGTGRGRTPTLLQNYNLNDQIFSFDLPIEPNKAIELIEKKSFKIK